MLAISRASCACDCKRLRTRLRTKWKKGPKMTHNATVETGVFTISIEHTDARLTARQTSEGVRFSYEFGGREVSVTTLPRLVVRAMAAMLPALLRMGWL